MHIAAYILYTHDLFSIFLFNYFKRVERTQVHQIHIECIYSTIQNHFFFVSMGHSEQDVIGSSANGFRAADAYRLLHSTGCGLPLHDLNWDNFAPVKVRVFIWILRHCRTRTRAPASSQRPGFPGLPLLLCSREGRVPPLRGLPPSAVRVETRVDDPSRFGLGVTRGYDRRLLWRPPKLAALLRTTAATALLWVTWKTRNRLVFDGVRHTESEFFAAVRQHLLLWIVRAPRSVDCGPLATWCALLSP
jgi:hypothetical protein